MCRKCEYEKRKAESENRKVNSVFCENWDKWVCPVCGREASPNMEGLDSDAGN